MQQSDYTPSYWMEVPLRLGLKERPRDGGIAIIGAGISGASVAYWLGKQGFDDLTLIDFEPEKAATLRNCGHILYGTVESMRALVALHGPLVAREIWDFSIQVCHTLRNTVKDLNIACDYAQDGYLVIAIDEVEDREIQESCQLLQNMGFASEYRDAAAVRQLGFKVNWGARFEPGSAQAHPVKFRNALIEAAEAAGTSYHTGWQVVAVEDQGDHVQIRYADGSCGRYEFAVIAANAYAPLLSSYYAQKRLVEPFRGQIITSAPLKHPPRITYPHSFDHGYIYALVTPDHRLMIGGWRNHTPHGEIGTYDLQPNPLVEDGLKEFVDAHYDLKERITWQYSWAGIMAASQTAFPFIGPTREQRIFTCAGFTGHGFSWAHGSAKLLADIMAGNPVPKVIRHFDPRR